MPRLAVVLSIVVVFAAALVYAIGTPHATAQDAMTSHPVVGMWRTTVANTGDTPFPSLTTFHADGTYTEVLPDGLVLTGLWHPTGERTADLTAYLNYFIDERLVEAEVRLMVAVDETNNALTEEGTLVGLYEDGSVATAVESPATGIRLGVLPVEPLGTPVLPPELTAEATPAA